MSDKIVYLGDSWQIAWFSSMEMYQLHKRATEQTIFLTPDIIKAIVQFHKKIVKLREVKP